MVCFATLEFMAWPYQTQDAQLDHNAMGIRRTPILRIVSLSCLQRIILNKQQPSSPNETTTNMSSPSLPRPPTMNPNIIFADLSKVPSLAKAHGIAMGIAFVILFPLGAFLIRFVRSKHFIWIHAGCQLVGWFLMIAGLATGIKMGKILDRVCRR